jgi:mannose/fructose/N-acetylgalactosamine-specific phosphotransferase system component IID
VNTDPKRAIGGGDLLGVCWRSLLIQASWSYDGMQSLGFSYAQLPVLKKLYPDRSEFESRLRLHMEYFNTQPYLASFILGAVVRLEEERAAGRASGSAVDPAGLKAALMAPLGALGDSFFWGALKPLAAVIAVALVMAGVWWAPVLFLALYNLWHVGLRLSVLFWGYHSSGDAMALMERYSFTKMARLFKAISLSVLGGLLAGISVWRMEFRPDLPLPAPVLSVAALVCTMALVSVLRRGGSPIKLMLGLAIFCLALAYAGVVL